jgi:TRAP-type C4-dicarboxylate transport system permease large subunit
MYKVAKVCSNWIQGSLSVSEVAEVCLIRSQSGLHVSEVGEVGSSEVKRLSECW